MRRPDKPGWYWVHNGQEYFVVEVIPGRRYDRTRRTVVTNDDLWVAVSGCRGTSLIGEFEAEYEVDWVGVIPPPTG